MKEYQQFSRFLKKRTVEEVGSAKIEEAPRQLLVAIGEVERPLPDVMKDCKMPLRDFSKALDMLSDLGLVELTDAGDVQRVRLTELGQRARDQT